MTKASSRSRNRNRTKKAVTAVTRWNGRKQPTHFPSKGCATYAVVLTNLFPAPEADGHAGHGKPMHEVGCAIHGVDYPSRGVREGCDGPSICARFLRRRKTKRCASLTTSTRRYRGIYSVHRRTSFRGAKLARLRTLHVLRLSQASSS